MRVRRACSLFTSRVRGLAKTSRGRRSTRPASRNIASALFGQQVAVDIDGEVLAARMRRTGKAAGDAVRPARGN